MINCAVNDLKTSNEVYDMLRLISRTSSRNEKIKLLEEAKASGNTLYSYVFKLVFDNTVNFGIKLQQKEIIELIGNSVPNPKTPFNTSITHFLTMLANGGFTRATAKIELTKFSRYLSSKSMTLLILIVNKDIEAGINSSTVNKVFKNLIPTFPYMRCSLPTKVDLKMMNWSLGVYAQEKADGMFVNINVSNGSVVLLSRQGTPIPTNSPEFDYLAKVMPSGYQVHGEMLVKDPAGRIVAREIGNGVINSWVKSNERPEGWTFVFHVWDAIPLQAVVPKGRYSQPYHNRFTDLKNSINSAIFRYELEGGSKDRIVEMIETKVCYSPSEAFAFYQNMLACGKEGAVLKESTAIWRDGTSKEQVKLKLECDCDLMITGFDKGDGKFSDTLGSIVCKTSDEQLVVNVSGFSDKVRRQIWDNQDDYLNTIVTVRFNNVLQGTPASLFLPRFVEFRTDKTEADSLARVIETQQRAMGL